MPWFRPIGELLSLDGSLDDSDLELQWTTEARRHRDEVRSGRVKPIPAEEVYRRIDRVLGK